MSEFPSPSGMRMMGVGARCSSRHFLLLWLSCLCWSLARSHAEPMAEVLGKMYEEIDQDVRMLEAEGQPWNIPTPADKCAYASMWTDQGHFCDDDASQPCQFSTFEDPDLPGKLLEVANGHAYMVDHGKVDHDQSGWYAVCGPGSDCDGERVLDRQSEQLRPFGVPPLVYKDAGPYLQLRGTISEVDEDGCVGGEEQRLSDMSTAHLTKYSLNTDPLTNLDYWLNPYPPTISQDFFSLEHYLEWGIAPNAANPLQSWILIHTLNGGLVKVGTSGRTDVGTTLHALRNPGRGELIRGAGRLYAHLHDEDPANDGVVIIIMGTRLPPDGQGNVENNEPDIGDLEKLLRSVALPMNEIMEGDRKERLLWHVNLRLGYGFEVMLKEAGGWVSEEDAQTGIVDFFAGQFSTPCRVVDDSMACPHDGLTAAAISLAQQEVRLLWKRASSFEDNVARFYSFRIQTGGTPGHPGSASKAYEVECCGDQGVADPEFTVKQWTRKGRFKVTGATAFFDPRANPLPYQQY